MQHSSQRIPTWLILDTGFPQGLVALVRAGLVLSQHTFTEQRLQDQHLAKAIDDSLAAAKLSLQDIHGIAVLKGPASFIGLRIAMAHAKGLCMALQIPLIGISSLLPFAATDGVVDGEGLIAVDARRGELFVQPYKRHTDKTGQIHVEASAEPYCIPQNVFATQAKTTAQLLGFGFDDEERPKGVSARGAWRILAQKLEDNASEGKEQDELFSLAPFYLRPPDATPPKL